MEALFKRGRASDREEGVEGGLDVGLAGSLDDGMQLRGGLESLGNDVDEEANGRGRRLGLGETRDEGLEAEGKVTTNARDQI